MFMKLPNPTTSTYYTLFFLSFTTFILSMMFTFYNSTTIIMWEIFRCFNSTLFFPIILDPTGLIFSSVVLFISANVIKFSKTYMKTEPFMNRFTHLVLLFIISMNLLIFLPNLITLLLGWDGLGLVSFILVIYYQNAKSLGAGMLTALTNRIGDAALLLSIGWTINSNNWSILNMWHNPLSNFIILCILLAAMTKSAQIPFSSWLPAAMAAPTPVSALVHSSTLVTAGVFLLIRFYPFLHTLNFFNMFLLCSSSMTMFMAGLSALTECDLKKIIALSTLSQLGVMMASLGLGFPKLAFFHLITHALFKALLFICAGSIIDLHQHNQDLRTVGNLTQQIPLTMSCFLVANMSLCGLPFLSGFYSKDLILETSMFFSTNWIIILLMFLATALTMMYSLRFIILMVWSPTLFCPIHSISNKDHNIYLPALTLTLGAIFVGALLNWLTSPLSQNLVLPPTLKMFPLFITIFGLLIVWSNFKMYSTTPNSLIFHKTSHEFSSYMWYLSPLSTQALLPFPSFLSHHLQKTLDQGWSETMSAQGAFSLFSSISKSIQPIQNNNIMALLNIMFLPIIMISIYM